MRATAIARDVFVAGGVDRCAWSDRKLAGRFDVDHVIPFLLWGNNDLWNLLPAHSRVNADKSDRLPGSALLLSRKASIVESWALLRDAMPEVFDQHASHLLGRSPDEVVSWQTDLFTRLREAVEVTACQRGVERWQPVFG